MKKIYDIPFTDLFPGFASNVNLTDEQKAGKALLKIVQQFNVIKHHEEKS